MYGCRKKKEVKSTVGHQIRTVHPILAAFTLVVYVSTVTSDEAKRKITLQLSYGTYTGSLRSAHTDTNTILTCDTAIPN